MRVWSLNRNAPVLNPVERLQELFSSIHPLSLESFRRELETHLTELRKPTWWPFLLDSLACDVFPYSDLSKLPFEKAAIFRPQIQKFRNAREWARDSILSAIVHAQADLDAWPSKIVWLQELQRTVWQFEHPAPRLIQWQDPATLLHATEYVETTTRRYVWARDSGLELYCLQYVSDFMKDTFDTYKMEYPAVLLQGEASYSASFRIAMVSAVLMEHVKPGATPFYEPLQRQWPVAYDRVKNALAAHAMLNERPWAEYVQPFRNIPAVAGLMQLIHSEIDWNSCSPLITIVPEQTIV